MLQAMYLDRCHAALGPLPHRRFSATAAVFMQRSSASACSFCEKAEQSALEEQAQVLGVVKPDGKRFSFAACTGRAVSQRMRQLQTRLQRDFGVMAGRKALRRVH